MGNLSDFLGASPSAGTHDFVASGTLPNGATVILNSDGTISTVTGNETLVGSLAVFESAASTDISIALLDVDKIVIAYVDSPNGSYGTAVVGTITGTDITFGTPVVFESASSGIISLVALDTIKFVISYCDYGNSNYGTSIVGSVAGTVITFGTAVTYLMMPLLSQSSQTA